MVLVMAQARSAAAVVVLGNRHKMLPGTAIADQRSKLGLEMIVSNC